MNDIEMKKSQVMAEGGGKDYKNMNDEGSDDLKVKESSSEQPNILKSDTKADDDKQTGPNHGVIETEPNVDTERAL